MRRWGSFVEDLDSVLKETTSANPKAYLRIISCEREFIVSSGLRLSYLAAATTTTIVPRAQPVTATPSSLLMFFKHCYACHHRRESFSSTMFMSSPRHHHRRLRLSHKLRSGWLVARSVAEESISCCRYMMFFCTLLHRRARSTIYLRKLNIPPTSARRIGVKRRFTRTLVGVLLPSWTIFSCSMFVVRFILLLMSFQTRLCCSSAVDGGAHPSASSFRLKRRKMAADDDLEDTATSPPHPSIVSKYLPHLLKTKKPIYDRYSVLFSIVIIWLYAQLLTSSTVYNHKPATTQKSCRTDQVGLLSTAPWIYIPYPFQWGASRYGSATPVPASIISRGSGWLGVGVLLNGMFGSVTGTCASVENAGLLALKRVGSRRVIQISAGFMIFFSVFEKFGALFASIPLPIIAALYCVFFGYVSSSGLGFLQFCNLNSFRTKFILGTSFFSGLSIPQYFREYYHRDLNPSEHIYSGQRWLPSLHPLMENLKKSVIKIAYSRDHADLSHLHRSFIPFLYMASSLYKLALSLRHHFYLYGILCKHR
ncbi:putative nucleobase-ascorbate transporter 10 [Cucumis melo var. makuwa]|uniref:Nucleobase-ascorbate transporter 10 n=1 Tax=Cucumis melo var. makuwa TaxID=1194695 RepID=A0A5A7U7R4_CUCMM|nr:putative nucleobase-ascorbate transporter 10 [Cucumis melo var. makuwa]